MSELTSSQEYVPSPGFILDVMPQHHSVSYEGPEGQGGGDLIITKDKTFKLDQIYVPEEYRGRGIGSKVLSEVIRLARLKGAKKLTGILDNTSPEARPFLEKSGFKFKELKNGLVEVSLKI